MSPVAPMGDLGPCFVRWDPDSANMDLNPTNGGVIARYNPSVRDIFTDQQGDTPVDGVDMGNISEIDVPMTEFSLHQLSEVFPGSIIVGDKLTILNTVGNRTYPQANKIIIKPAVNNAASALTPQWMTFLHCYPVAAQELSFSKDDQRTVMVTFKVYPSQTTATLNQMGFYGTE